MPGVMDRRKTGEDHTHMALLIKNEGDIWGGAAITPGSKAEMSSLRAEHGRGALVYCSFCMPFKYTWEDNMILQNAK